MSGTTASALSGLAGALWLRPGAPLGRALRSTRRDLAGQVCQGKPASMMPLLLGSLFSLCGNAHRICSELALSAASGEDAGVSATLEQALRTETATEHVRRMALDWPRLLGTTGFAASHRATITAELKVCPLLSAPKAADGSVQMDGAAVLAWLERHWLEMPATDWLDHWSARPLGWLADWSVTSGHWLPSLLRTARDVDTPMPWNSCLSLAPHAFPTGMASLSRELSEYPGFSLLPQWQGQCAHTGTWNRLHTAASLPASAWLLLGSRLAELIRLCMDGDGDGGTQCLAWGRQAAGPRQGIGWVEMARGLLVHRVSLNDDATVAQYRVLAPTEWNFHPHGIAAQAISDLSSDTPDLGRRIALIMSALDPCVPYETEFSVQESHHA